MEQLKLGIKFGENTIFDLDAILIRLLVVGQHRQLQVKKRIPQLVLRRFRYLTCMTTY